MDGKDATSRPLRGRFAPSPTGDLHLGNARTALLAWLSVRARGGAFVLRMEDLDKPRERPGAAERILRSLRWLGLDWDEGPDVGGPFGPYVQSERAALYDEAVRRLLDAGLAFECWCSRKDGDRRRQRPASRRGGAALPRHLPGSRSPPRRRAPRPGPHARHPLPRAAGARRLRGRHLRSAAHRRLGAGGRFRRAPRRRRGRLPARRGARRRRHADHGGAARRRPPLLDAAADPPLRGARPSRSALLPRAARWWGPTASASPSATAHPRSSS